MFRKILFCSGLLLANASVFADFTVEEIEESEFLDTAKLEASKKEKWKDALEEFRLRQVALNSGRAPTDPTFTIEDKNFVSHFDLTNFDVQNVKITASHGYLTVGLNLLERDADSTDAENDVEFYIESLQAPLDQVRAELSKKDKVLRVTVPIENSYTIPVQDWKDDNRIEIKSEL